MEKSMKVAMIVVAFNNAKETIQYINQVANYENIQRIVVVDNRSTDLNTMSLLKQIENEKVHIVQEWGHVFTFFSALGPNLVQTSAGPVHAASVSVSSYVCRHC